MRHEPRILLDRVEIHTYSDDLWNCRYALYELWFKSMRERILHAFMVVNYIPSCLFVGLCIIRAEVFLGPCLSLRTPGSHLFLGEFAFWDC